MAEIERLVRLDPRQGTPKADRLEVLALLVEKYEQASTSISAPSPIEALKFRMEQEGLTPRDLIPLIGNRSKVSEVLAGKRPLTLSMIRAIHAQLGIAAEVLLQDPKATLPENTGIEWRKFPLREMAKRGWFSGNCRRLAERAEEIMRDFFAPLGEVSQVAALYRRTLRERAPKKMDPYAIWAWTARVLILAKTAPPCGTYKSGTVTKEFMQEIARLSWSDRGPLLASEFLTNHGIRLIVEPHLPRTHLDGAAMLGFDGTPVIGLTIRHDRIDNFWYCLMHELAHIGRHLSHSNAQKDLFIDDLDSETDDAVEQEADALAAEALIPRRCWPKSSAARPWTPEAIHALAQELRIHPAIIAGRIRHDSGNYRILNNLVGHGAVRRHFMPT
jgi:HTH-type transcriptional regulator/antitoxin HigA